MYGKHKQTQSDVGYATACPNRKRHKLKTINKKSKNKCVFVYIRVCVYVYEEKEVNDKMELCVL